MKAGPGPVNAPAVVAGTAVRRGDVIVADDGVLCVPLQEVPSVAAKAWSARRSSRSTSRRGASAVSRPNGVEVSACF
ncbi:hypothetical protein [Streptomyces viridochromogenes]|uniref:hypothetical protein n=1 Tax=Streptomyces viridochromogenes TaxID=1938 RepID=UPI001F2BF90A